ncbi:hypothetical protein BJ138DRAFT_1099189 [Hygrophoropsis aurantiaca]|uniref:Uncharacterized protein n=1 Tax=Hygrophoropsis aurantiaca TaxID=72124 RepID=A0ACB8AKK4_9AGAM|nr:hypothetical protein BJ138DRAFT_1099189 [Hygrophoropsis aurantiaca]
MRSFGLSLLFTAALSAFTFAAPVAPDTSALTGGVTGLTGTLGKPLGGLQTRDETPKSLAVILAGVTTELTPLTAQLTYINSANATVAIVQPIVGQISDCLLTATASIKLLVGAKLEVILAPIEGTVLLTVAAVLQLVAGVLCLLFTAVGCLLKVVVGDVRAALLPILVNLCVVVAGLLKVVFSLNVQGLVATALCALLPEVVIAVIKLLACTELLLCLGIKL